ncbi:MAG: DUF1292 domain-containing protein [Clostridiales bacterium]|jgi:uncharacterized protein YrzB (UPF0473 family)|nr:DUF1292 domain-containing protein [Clostridiales bacterium]
MMDEERLDIIETSDEEGNQHFLRVEKYFYYNGEEYVLLREVESAEDESPSGAQSQLYVMQVLVSQDEEGDEIEDFVPIESDLMETLIQTFRVTYAPPTEEEADPAE